MHAAILCPGPSLPGRYSGVHDLVIAVNAAIEFNAKIDLWCCFDWQTFGKFQNNETPAICRKDVWQIGIESGAQYENPLALLVDPEAEDTPPDVDGRYTWSSCGAVIAAYMLGADRIAMYGADMTGDTDYRGTSSKARGDNRWSREMESLTSLMGWMRQQNVIVERA